MNTFDFQGYISNRKNPEERAKSLTFGDYAFRGDIKWLRTLTTLVPVRLMVGATMQLWSGWGRKEVLADAVRASEKDASRLLEVSNEAARALHMAPIPVYLTHHLKEVPAQALGDDEETFIAVHTGAVREMSDPQLTFVIGRQLGHAQNGHVIYQTAAFYVDEIANVVVRWAVAPGQVALNQWRRRAAITADRAGLLACRSLEVAGRQIIDEAIALERLEKDVDVDAFVKALEADGGKAGFFDKLTLKAPAVSIRLAALRAFSETQYYFDHIGKRSTEGRSMAEVDDEVEAVLRDGAGAPTSE
ncbi:MAG: hypothetical protein CO108_08300 [Deltaproteobacteria bacterium CG_4_9_14_3_um_filter_63_12]|nr:MAG: hypothetical protein CO108_08300 [Deltaproteobacteria bacterium CG_4_9_14_3_um_filter_63_12]